MTIIFFILFQIMGNHKHKKEKSSKKEHKESSREHKKHKKSSRQKDDEIDYSDPSLWVEAEDNTEMTPAEYLRNQQQNTDAKNNLSQETMEQPMQENARHGWMLDSGFDFGSLGTARQKEEDKSKPNPDEVRKLQDKKKKDFNLLFLSPRSVHANLTDI